MGSPNVILIIFDAMRKDVLRVYGGSSHTPYIDEFCHDAAVYRNCVSPSPWTIPSHASLFTGRYASEHGVHETHDKKVRDILGEMSNTAYETIAERLKKKGYQTIGYSANSMLSIHKGFDRGFDSFTATMAATAEELAFVHEATKHGRGRIRTVWNFLSAGRFRDLLRLYSIYRRLHKLRKLADYPRGKGANIVVDRVNETRLDAPFFLFINFMEMHDPYTDYEQKPENRGVFLSVQMADLYGYRPIPEDAMLEIKRNYYLCATGLDRSFGRLIADLKRKGLYEESMIILTSDHGQALREHGFFGHGTFLYDELLEIPLIIKYPNGKVKTADDGYQNLVDIPSHIMEVVGGEASPDSLTRKVTYSESFGTQNMPPRTEDSRLMETILEGRGRADIPRKAVFKDGRKLVLDWTGRRVEELNFNGKPLDPSEERGVVDSLTEELLSFERSHDQGSPQTTALSPEEEATVSDRLKELGYL